MDAQQAAPAGKEDLSSRTILILTVLVVLVSIIGAWVNISMSTAISSNTQPKVNTQSAQVGFVIESKAPEAKDTSSGKAEFVIEK